MKFFLEQFPTILEYICIAIITKSFSRQSLRPTSRDIGMLFAICLLSFIPNRYPIALWMIGLFIYFFYITFSVKKSFWDRLNLYFLSYGSIILLNLLSYVLISLILSTEAWYVPILGNLCSIFFAILLFRYSTCRKLYEFLCVAKLPYKLFWLNTFLLFILMLLFFKINANDFYINLIYWLAITIFLFITNICILYYDRQLFEKQQKLISYEKNLPIYQALIDEIRGAQHEFSNRIQHFQKLPYVCKDYKSLSQALLENSAYYRKPLQNYKLLQINMPLLAATLYSFACKAAQQNIILTFNIQTLDLISSVPEYQLTDYVSILTQNAIESSKKGDRIYLSISSNQNRFQLEIRNPSEKHISATDIKHFFEKGYSSKGQIPKSDHTPHGYGLYFLHHKITHLGGTIGAECMEFQKKYWIIFRLEI